MKYLGVIFCSILFSCNPYYMAHDSPRDIQINNSSNLTLQIRSVKAGILEENRISWDLPDSIMRNNSAATFYYQINIDSNEKIINISLIYSDILDTVKNQTISYNKYDFAKRFISQPDKTTKYFNSLIAEQVQGFEFNKVAELGPINTIYFYYYLN